ncbi:MAG: hypothetical protein FJ288_18360, partial [Planctomycetes bacterium]|nr:hypothetical protein [Planctomycetota bacterium]
MNHAPMPADRRDQILVRYLDGNLSAAETDALNALLSTDAEARAALREMATQAVAMGDLAREQAMRSPPRSAGLGETAGPRGWRRAAVAVAAGAAAAVIV